jgi:hypothetical protein
MNQKSNYQTRPTQEDQILQLLNEKPEGVYVYELIAPYPQGLGIAQYNARIYGLRHRGIDIRNDVPGHFYLYKEPKQTSFIPVDPGQSRGANLYD